MRIESTSNSRARQQYKRRHSAEGASRANSPASNNTRSPRMPADTPAKTGSMLVPVLTNSSAHKRPSVGRRWRSHTPFLAQYIGQKTATETDARATRRAPEKAHNAYNNCENPPAPVRTIASL